MANEAINKIPFRSLLDATASFVPPRFVLCALMYRQNGDLANLLKSVRKKVPQSARLSAGGRGGCNRYLGNAQIEVPLTALGLP